jgi:hypothetical protein
MLALLLYPFCLVEFHQECQKQQSRLPASGERLALLTGELLFYTHLRVTSEIHS